ncbi:hypothetical protein [Pediococcus pentosaceus]|jgi:hypothetical protein
MKSNLPDLDDTNYKIIKAEALLNYIGDDLSELSDKVDSEDNASVIAQARNMNDRAFFTYMAALDLIKEIQKDVEACIVPIDEVSERASNQ